jgi:hypothetical protein
MANSRSVEAIESPATDEPADVAFCEMVKNPQLYFDRPVRVTAIVELATEGQCLSDDACQTMPAR